MDNIFSFHMYHTPLTHHHLTKKILQINGVIFAKYPFINYHPLQTYHIVTIVIVSA